MANVKRGKKIHEPGPWDENGQLRLPPWIEAAGPMDPAWPVVHFWVMTGKAALEDRGE